MIYSYVTKKTPIPRDVIAIVGPTAVGKTAVGIELATMLDGEIISADSMAVYTGMDIGTAKPTEAEQSRTVFHCIDIADPRQDYSVGEFQKTAHSAIDDIFSRGRVPIVVGGSGLYVKAALYGIDDSLPGENAVLRASLYSEAEEHGKEAVHRRLAGIDPESAAAIPAGNLKRVIRAIEISMTIGRPVSELRAAANRLPNRRPLAHVFGLTMPREALHVRIDERVGKMMESGLIEEVRKLMESGVSPESTAMQGLGYKEIAAYLAGECLLDEAVDAIKRGTKRFVKRQYTWFRADVSTKWIDVSGMKEASAAQQIAEELARAV